MARGQTHKLAGVVVSGYRFLDRDISGITNLPLPIEKVPQSVSVLNNDFVQAADLKNMGEIAQETPGALWASYSPSYGNQIWLRGFAANYAIDGLTVGDQITEPDAATLDRYEIVKGPASVVYGAQSPGGIVNLDEKHAPADGSNYLEALGGSWGRWRVEGQAAGPLNASHTIRGILVGAQEDGGSFVDFVKNYKSVAYGGLDFLDLSRRLSGYVRAGYQRTQDTPYNGIPTFADGSLVPVPPSFFLGGSDFDALAQATHADAGLSWQASSLWSFDLKSVFQHTTHGGRNAYPYSTIAADGTFPSGGENFNDWHVEDFTVGGSATRKLDDIGLSNSSISANVRYQHYRYYIFEDDLGGGTGAPNIFDGDREVSDYFNSLTITTSNYEQDQRMNYLTASSQAVVQVARPVTLVGGIAYSKPTVDQQVYSGSFQNYDPGDQVDYRAAVIVTPTTGLNLYASYSESYAPNLRIDVEDKVLAPVQGKQYEVGAKYLPTPRLLLTAAAFDIEESNVAVYDTTVSDEALYQAEGVRHRGLEFEATGRLTDRWQARGGVALLDPTVTNDPQDPVNDGEIRPWLPRSDANLYTSYDVGRGFSVGGGARYSGSVKTYDNSSPSPTAAIRAYTVIDGGVGYTIRHWRLQVNVKNIFDERYYVPTPVFASLAAGLYPGEPRSVAVSTRYEF